MNNFDYTEIAYCQDEAIEEVFDLSVEHTEHSFVHESGVILHNSAYIISDKPIDEFIPLMTVGGTRVTQYTATSCEASGALKMDYLGLNTLVDLSEVLRLVQERSQIKLDKEYYTINCKKVPAFRVIPKDGVLYDLWELPEDQDVFRDICEGITETVFQLNTSSALKWLEEFNYWKNEDEGQKLISSIEDLAAFVALDRPGPLDAEIVIYGKKRNMLQEYAARARGERASDPIEFLIKELPETYGILTYQEQVQSVFQKLTGCSGIEANNFRDDVGKKRVVKVQERYSIFIERAKEKVGEVDAQKIWDQLVTFGSYGFNKAHAASYALTGYACAYLKHHFPLEWWCAVLRNADKNEIAETFWKYCKDWIQLPDVNLSGKQFSIVNDKIVAPTSMLQGVGENAHKELVSNAPYIDIDDFCEKIKKHKINNARQAENGKVRKGVSALNRGVVYKLIAGGVMDSLFPKGIDVMSKLEKYEESLAKAMGAKKPEKIKDDFRELNRLKIYQHKKAILPVYSEDLVPMLYDFKINGVIKKQKEGLGTVYSYNPTDEKVIQEILRGLSKKQAYGTLAFVDGNVLRYLEDSAIIDEENKLHVAVAAYIISHRKFQYKSKKTGETLQACEFVLDINGEIFKFVKWPNIKKELPIPEGELDGAVVITLLSRWNNKYGFGVDAMVKIFEPLEEK